MTELYYTAKDYEEAEWEDFVTKNDQEVIEHENSKFHPFHNNYSEKKAIVTIFTFREFLSSSTGDNSSEFWHITPQSGNGPSISKVYYPPLDSHADLGVEFIAQDDEDSNAYTVVLAKGIQLTEETIKKVLFELNWVFGEDFEFYGNPLY